MRQIKFRAWNTEMNYMVFPSLEFGRELWPCTYKRIVKNETDKDGYTKEVVLEMVSIDHIIQSPEFDVMQFTGVLDKNGKDIYEGDILKGLSYSSNRLNNPTEAIGVVEYNTDWAAFQFKKVSKNDSTIPNLSDCEVIGNIYDNPELINF